MVEEQTVPLARNKGGWLGVARICSRGGLAGRYWRRAAPVREIAWRMHELGLSVARTRPIEGTLLVFPALLKFQPESHARFIAQRGAKLRRIGLDDQFHLLHEALKLLDELLIQ